MERIERVMTRLTNELGLSLDRIKAVKELKVEPLKRIPDPPEVYKKWRCLIRGDEDRPDQIDKGRRTLIHQTKDDDVMKKIQKYEKRLTEIVSHNKTWAEMALAIGSPDFEGDGMAPVEKIERREGDKRKHGQTQWMLICGFEFWMDGEQIKWRKLYTPLDPDAPKWDVWKFLRGEKIEERVLMPGSGERGYPMEWDEVQETDKQQQVDDF